MRVSLSVYVIQQNIVELLHKRIENTLSREVLIIAVTVHWGP